MVLIKYIIFVFAVLFCFACKAQNSYGANFLDQELDWKSVWINIFFDEYLEYTTDKTINCHDGASRDIVFDIERKLRAITEVPLNLALRKFSIYIKDRIKNYDEIIMLNIHSYHFEEEFITPPISFYLIKNDTADLIIGNINSNTISFMDYPDKVNWKEYLNNLKDGCGYGYVTHTSLSNDLKKLKIERIVINPYED